MVTLILRKINPESTALLHYSLPEFYGCKLADLGNLEFRFYLATVDPCD
jgi:hypothetical protein